MPHIRKRLGDAEGFLKKMNKTPCAIDECQLAPSLFPALKERVRTHPKPFTIPELEGKSLPQSTRQCLTVKDFTRSNPFLGHVAYFEDQAESAILSHGSLSHFQQLAGLLFRNLRSQWLYQPGSNARFFHYLTIGGANVPWVVEENGSTLGFLPFEGEEPSRSTMAISSSFLSMYSNSKLLLVSNSWANAPTALNSRVMAISTADRLS